MRIDFEDVLLYVLLVTLFILTVLAVGIILAPKSTEFAPVDRYFEDCMATEHFSHDECLSITISRVGAK